MSILRKLFRKSTDTFCVDDRVYMNTPVGMYTGIVRGIKGAVMTIEAHTPTGDGILWLDCDIIGTDWKKM